MWRFNANCCVNTPEAVHSLRSVSKDLVTVLWENLFSPLPNKRAAVLCVNKGRKWSQPCVSHRVWYVTWLYALSEGPGLIQLSQSKTFSPQEIWILLNWNGVGITGWRKDKKMRVTANKWCQIKTKQNSKLLLKFFVLVFCHLWN